MSNRIVLIADDDQWMRDLLSTVLSTEDIPVILAVNGREAVEKAITTLPALIVLDGVMPEMDGFTALKTLKADEKTQAIPVIMLTGKHNDKDISTGLTTGAAEYIVKPFMPKAFLERVKTYLG